MLLTYEKLDLETLFLVRRYLRISASSQGHRSKRSHERKQIRTFDGLPSAKRVKYKLGITMFSCLWRQAHQCTWLISVNQSLASPHDNISDPPTDDSWSYCAIHNGWWTFSVVGQSVWNTLPGNLRDQIVSRDSFRRPLKALVCNVWQITAEKPRDACSNTVMHQWIGEWHPLFITDNYTVFASFSCSVLEALRRRTT